MDDHRTWCPSAPADRPEAVVLGVHTGSEGLTYLAMPVPAQEALAMVPAGVEPTELLRFAGFCDQACRHRIGTDCGLVTKVAVGAPVAGAGTTLPRGNLRPRCQWWKQSGATACRRCPLVVTSAPESEADELTRQIADPALGPDDLQRE